MNNTKFVLQRLFWNSLLQIRCT